MLEVFGEYFNFCSSYIESGMVSYCQIELVPAEGLIRKLKVEKK